jgi:prepilin peptidase CpaA
MLSYFIIILLVTVLAAACVTDIRARKIPNLLTFPAIVTAMGYHVATTGLQGFFFSAGGMMLGIALFIMLYMMGGMGAGDVKLMGAVGAALGPKGVFMATILTGIVGGIYAIIVLIKHTTVKTLIRRWGNPLKTVFMKAQYIPVPESDSEKKHSLHYGIAIACGTVLYIVMNIVDGSTIS